MCINQYTSASEGEKSVIVIIIIIELGKAEKDHIYVLAFQRLLKIWDLYPQSKYTLR